MAATTSPTSNTQNNVEKQKPETTTPEDKKVSWGQWTVNKFNSGVDAVAVNNKLSFLSNWSRVKDTDNKIITLVKMILGAVFVPISGVFSLVGRSINYVSSCFSSSEAKPNDSPKNEGKTEGKQEPEVLESKEAPEGSK